MLSSARNNTFAPKHMSLPFLFAIVVAAFFLYDVASIHAQAPNVKSSAGRGLLETVAWIGFLTAGGFFADIGFIQVFFIVMFIFRIFSAVSNHGEVFEVEPESINLALGIMFAIRVLYLGIIASTGFFV